VVFLAGNDFTLRMRSLSSGETIRVLEGHDDDIRALGISRSDLYIASGSSGATVSSRLLNAG